MAIPFPVSDLLPLNRNFKIGPSGDPKFGVRDSRRFALIHKGYAVYLVSSVCGFFSSPPPSIVVVVNIWINQNFPEIISENRRELMAVSLSVAKLLEKHLKTSQKDILLFFGKSVVSKRTWAFARIK